MAHRKKYRAARPLDRPKIIPSASAHPSSLAGTAATRFLAISQYSEDSSIPIKCRPVRFAATAVVPEPMQLSEPGRPLIGYGLDEIFEEGDGLFCVGMLLILSHPILPHFNNTCGISSAFIFLNYKCLLQLHLYPIFSRCIWFYQTALLSSLMGCM